MLKSDLQHQFWVTKKAVQRKLGSKEDECIVSSDAELDSKIELLKSIGDSCTQLKRIIDNYQEKIYVLAQEESATGTFLKESGKHSTTSSRVMCCAGKAISYCGQQHMKMRSPLVRLQHEVETFTGRGIKDTYGTVQAMERERTEYRAALGWMKAASQQLDPDKGRGLDKFRNAQMYVRTAKTKFDTMTLDCLQKIDLLAAARCNMFSHVLVAYQAALLDFATKTTYTFEAAGKILEEKTHYNFTILKDLTQVPSQRSVDEQKGEIAPLDFDQMLFFKEEYEDNVSGVKKKSESASSNANSETTNNENASNSKAQSSTSASDNKAESSLFMDLLDISGDEANETDILLSCFNEKSESMQRNSNAAQQNSSISTGLAFDLFKRLQPASSAHENDSKKLSSNKSKSGEKSAWFDLFADLDPLANPTAIEKRISGPNQNCLDA